VDENVILEVMARYATEPYRPAAPKADRPRTVVEGERRISLSP
jgi:hypothetical protein